MKSRAHIFVVTIVLALLPTFRVRAQPTNPAYLSQMPSVTRVKAEIRGVDSIDTSARQIAALTHLIEVINRFAGPRYTSNQFTPDEDRLKSRYFNAWQVYLYKVNAPRPQDIPRWNKLRAFYETDPGFRDEVLRQFLSPEVTIAYYRAIGKEPPSQPKSAQAPAAVNQPQTAAGQSPPKPAASDNTAKPSSSNVSESDLYFAKGASMQKFKQYDAALEAYQKAIALEPKSKNAALSHKQIGMIYNDRERYREAIPHFVESLRIDPDNAVVDKELGFAYYMLDAYQHALVVLQRAIALKPDYSQAYYFLGMTYLEMGQKDEALRVYREMSKVNKQEAEDLYAKIIKRK
jgi:tetratricopeptide (TPR) repeat protein